MQSVNLDADIEGLSLSTTTFLAGVRFFQKARVRQKCTVTHAKEASSQRPSKENTGMIESPYPPATSLILTALRQ
jgi:hypothetical protein